jgi:dolichyl-phosphate beta-glucosyltransferase
MSAPARPLSGALVDTPTGRGVCVTTVIPAYNEGERLATFLDSWAAEGQRATAITATVIVVDDGSAPAIGTQQQAAVEATAARLRSARAAHRIEYVRAPSNRGKGAAIRLGWGTAGADAEWLGFIDADGAVPAREYWRVASGLPGSTSDAVCGSRVKMAGRTVERSLFRHLQGRAFATLVDELFHLGFYDTQCGFKFFRTAVVRPLLPLLTEDRWLLDVEVLERMRGVGARFEEVPVDCHQQPGSSVVFGLDPLRMAFRLLALRRRLRDKGAR